jgi:hypothetical protein
VCAPVICRMSSQMLLVIQRGLKFLMSPCQLEEIQAVLGPVHVPDANFSYTVFGGSARMANLLNTKATLADTDLCDVAEAQLRQYLGGSESQTRTTSLCRPHESSRKGSRICRHRHQRIAGRRSQAQSVRTQIF